MSMHHHLLLFRNLKALSLVGMWPPENEKLHTIYDVYSKFIFIWFCCFTTSQLIEICFVYDDFQEFTTNTGVSLLYVVAIAKVFTVLFKKKQIHTLVNVIRDTEMKILNQNNAEIQKLLRGYISQSWGVTKKFWTLTFWTILGFFISPKLEFMLSGPQEILLKNGTSSGRFKKPLVFSSWLPFDKYAPKFYPLAYGIQTFSGTIGASYLGIWDTFIVALMIFPIGQFRILQHSLRNLNSVLYDDKICGESDANRINRNFVQCVKHHNTIIKFVKDLDSLISPVMFLDFCVCSLMLCAIGLEATLEGPSFKLAFTIEYLIAMLIQLFMFYWHANELILESVRVNDAAWESQWYEFPTSIKKGLLLVMMRAQKPVAFTAGQFYAMSLQTFLTILRASYSYLALLRQIYGHDTENKS